MTHTLHRFKEEGLKEDDFIILAMPARGINNDENTVQKLQKFLEIFHNNNAVNMGGMGTGILVDTPYEKIIENVYFELPMVHGVFDNKENLVSALKDIKEADMGISVIVSGLIDAVDKCVAEAGINRHSVNYSLGIWGDKSKLPDESYLEIATMCGHAMVSPSYIAKMVNDIKQNRITIEKAAKKLSQPCVCGIFNPKKAEKVLRKIVGEEVLAKSEC